MHSIMSLCPHSDDEDLMPKVTAFGYRAYKEIIKVKWGLKSKALIWLNRCFYKTVRDTIDLSPPLHLHTKILLWRFSKNWPSTSQEESTHHKLTLMAPWSQAPSLENCKRVSFCGLTQSVMLSMAALTNEYSKQNISKHEARGVGEKVEILGCENLEDPHCIAFPSSRITMDFTRGHSHSCSPGPRGRDYLDLLQMEPCVPCRVPLSMQRLIIMCWMNDSLFSDVLFYIVVENF